MVPHVSFKKDEMTDTGTGMVKIKAAELSGVALDWAVARCEGYFDDTPHYTGSSITADHFLRMWDTDGHGCHWAHSSTDWAECGPIINKARICINWVDRTSQWAASNPQTNVGHFYADTPEIAAMRCYVAGILGDEFEVPEMLSCLEARTPIRPRTRM